MEKKYWFSDQHNNGTSKRDFYLKYDTEDTALLKRYQRLGLMKHCQKNIDGYIALKDELVWEVGTTKLHFFQIDSLKNDQKTAIAKLSHLQSEIEALENPKSICSKALLTFKIQLSELIRNTLHECETELRSYHFTFQRVNDALKFCLKHVDEFELKEQTKPLALPSNNDSISIKHLHDVGHIHRLSNSTPAGIAQGLNYNAYVDADEIFLHESGTESQLEPNWHHRKLPFIGISVQTVVFVTFLIASPWIFLLLQSKRHWKLVYLSFYSCTNDNVYFVIICLIDLLGIIFKPYTRTIRQPFGCFYLVSKKKHHHAHHCFDLFKSNSTNQPFITLSWPIFCVPIPNRFELHRHDSDTIYIPYVVSHFRTY